ncbi:MAG: rhodanese-like domain-containing protein [Desulfatiglandaceae bacterium]|jgi:rhodanese-related sulfurtransferase
MKRVFVLLIAVAFVAGAAGLAFAGNDTLKANEHKVWESFVKEIPANHMIDVFKLHEVWQKAMADPAYRKTVYLLDVRTDSEFDAFHIEGTDHMQAGHMYVLTKKIKDPNAQIYVWCRTSHRAKYVSGFLYKYGYKNVYCVSSTTRDGKKNVGGVVGWAQAGFPFVNQFTGVFYIKEYRSSPSKEDTSYHFRMWHPY